MILIVSGCGAAAAAAAVGVEFDGGDGEISMRSVGE